MLKTMFPLDLGENPSTFMKTPLQVYSLCHVVGRVYGYTRMDNLWAFREA